MDLGVLGLDGLVGSEGGFGPLFSEAETREKWGGSGVSKQGRSGLVEDDWRMSKVAKTDDFGVSKAMLMQSKNPSTLRSASMFSDGQQQLLLSFSSPKPDGVIGSDGFVERSYQNTVLPYYHSTSAYGRNAGLGSGSLNENMHCGALTGVRGPFTPSQWMELEHQALIYKYITANAPIPTNLLIPIRKSLCPTGFSGFSAGSLRPNSLGWGSFHLGFSGNTDPEPGRCRRTDGKKWRCSRDAVADQKYCERHMNRGRHRSRKPVEGQTGHASSGTAAAAKAMPAIASAAAAASPVPGCGTSNSLAIAQQQLKSLQPGVDTSSTHVSRMLMNKMNVGDHMQDSQSLSILSTVDKKSKDSQFVIPKQHLSLEETSRSEFGLVPSDSLTNPHRSSYELNDQESQSHPLRHFIDNWPKSPSDRSAITWPEVEKIQSDRTQLSISIPVASSDFSSSTSSPTQERVTLSPLKLSCELDPIQMGLGVGAVHESTQRQANWIPISWESSMGGPLGEVLKNTNNSQRDHKNSSSVLNLMTEGWDASPQIGSSPTGVLQKTFGSFSNSSTGSSPRTEVNKTHDHTSLCDDLLGSTLVNSTVPSM